jgi:hypothetical protein
MRERAPPLPSGGDGAAALLSRMRSRPTEEVCSRPQLTGWRRWGVHSWRAGVAGAGAGRAAQPCSEPQRNLVQRSTGGRTPRAISSPRPFAFSSVWAPCNGG